MKRYIKSTKSSDVYTVILQENELYRDGLGSIVDCGVNEITTEVHSFEEASKAIRNYIEHYNLGSSTFSGGDVYDSQGRKVARISYNGRIWLPGSEFF